MPEGTDCQSTAGQPTAADFDEPSTGIDVKSQQELYKFMQELHEQGITIITVEHNLKFAARNADKCIMS